LENHPFTIATAAPRGPSSISDEQQQKPRLHLVFLARTHAGFTRKLAARLASADDASAAPAPVWLDGPYGGLPRPPHKRFDALVLVAGGTGITACFPWLQDAVARAGGVDDGEERCRGTVKRVVLLWAVKRVDAVLWLSEELDALAKAVPKARGLAVEVRLHVTGDLATEPLDSTADTDAAKDGLPHVDISLVDEKPPSTANPPSSSAAAALSCIAELGAAVHTGRPLMPAVLKDVVRRGERTMVIGCGPHTFMADLGNAVAESQTMVLKGEIVELAMNLETFGW
jgi:NAD(P)H-flavin reductase